MQAQALRHLSVTQFVLLAVRLAVCSLHMVMVAAAAAGRIAAALIRLLRRSASKETLAVPLLEQLSLPRKAAVAVVVRVLLALMGRGLLAATVALALVLAL
jgi:hypothetical protein